MREVTVRVAHLEFRHERLQLPVIPDWTLAAASYAQLTYYFLASYANLFSLCAAAYEEYSVWVLAAAFFRRLNVAFSYDRGKFLQLIGWCKR